MKLTIQYRVSRQLILASLLHGCLLGLVATPSFGADSADQAKADQSQAKAKADQAKKDRQVNKEKRAAGDPAAKAREDAPGKLWAFVGTYTGGKGKGIFVYSFDLAAGVLEPISVGEGATNPSFLAIHPSHKFLYAVSETSDFEGKPSGAVAAFSLDPATGKLKFLNQQSSEGAGPCHLVVDQSGKNVLVANYGGGSVAVLPIADDGKLQKATSSIKHGAAATAPAGRESHAHSINLDKDNRFAVAADLGFDQLLVYRFKPETGTLTANDPPLTKLRDKDGPRHFAFHPSGRFGYVINETSLTVTALEYDAAEGTLKEMQRLGTLPGERSDGFSTAEVQVHPSGKFLYGSNRGHDTIAIFSIDQETGRLTATGHAPTGGKTPRNFGIDPTGKYLLACNQDSNSIVVFKIDQETGKLTATGATVEVPTPVCVKMMAIGE